MASTVSSGSAPAGGMERTLRIIDAISERSGKGFSFVVFIGAVVITYNVLMRYLFRDPTIWADGTAQRLFAAYYILAGAYVLRYKAHINMDVVYNHWSPRTRAIVDLFTSVCFFAFCVTLLVGGAIYAGESVRIGETDGTTFHAVVYPVKIMIPVGTFLLLLQGVAKFVRDLKFAVTGRAYES